MDTKNWPCVPMLSFTPWFHFYCPFGMILLLFDHSFVNGRHLIFVVDEDPTIGSLWNYIMLLYVLCEGLRNLRIRNPMYVSSGFNNLKLWILVVDEDLTVGSLWNYSMLLYALYEDLTNLHNGNLTYESSELDY